MMPTKKRLVIFLALWGVYLGATTITTVAKKVASHSFFASFAQSPQQVEIKSAAERYLNTSKEIFERSPQPLKFDRAKYDQIVYSYTVTYYLGLSLWFYICACLFTHPRWVARQSA